MRFGFARIVLGATALIYCWLASVAIVSPESIASTVQFELTSPTAVTDLRATYGGQSLGLMIFFAICAFYAPAIPLGLAAAALIFGGLVLTRVMGIVIDGPQEPVTYLLLASEIAGCIAACIALYRHRRLSATLPS